LHRDHRHRYPSVWLLACCCNCCCCW
jgi:hypothetical protein